MPIALFDKFPALRDEIAHVPLGVFPTAVEALPLEVAREHGVTLYIKRDDTSGELYGGNKVRKLEFELARALTAGAAEVMTFGTAGSNHATATAIYAQRLGMRSLSVLTPQSNARYVARNLRRSFDAGAELHHYTSEAAAANGARFEMHRRRVHGQPPPYRIPGGGSSVWGTFGFVSAGLELAAQVRDGSVPEPDDLYLPLGTMGTAAGLILGLAAGGLSTRVTAVRVVRDDIGSADRLARLLRDTHAALKNTGATLPDPAELQFTVRDEFFGDRYARFTEEGMAAIDCFATRGIGLEGTYTGKAAAALLKDIAENRLEGRTVLFWNTYNSRPFPPHINDIDYHDLPATVHHYFETPVQPLDRQASGHVD